MERVGTLAPRIWAATTTRLVNEDTREDRRQGRSVAERKASAGLGRISKGTHTFAEE